MKKLVLASVLVLSLSLTAQPRACGQTLYGGGMGYGPVSPYVNLNRAGAPLGVNYFNLVQPQMQFTSQIGSLQRTTGMMQSGMMTPPGMGMGMDPYDFYTGHYAFFGNTSHYYTSRRGMMGMGGMGMGGMGMGGMGMGGMGMGGMGGMGMGMGGMGGMGSMGGGGMGLGGMGAMMQNFPGRMGRPPIGFLQSGGGGMGIR